MPKTQRARTVLKGPSAKAFSPPPTLRRPRQLPDRAGPTYLRSCGLKCRLPATPKRSLSSRRSQNINLKLRKASIFGDLVSTKLTIMASTRLPTYTGTGMSHRTTRSAQAARSQHSPHHPGQIRAARSAHGAVRVIEARAPGRSSGLSAYTIGQSGKQVRLGPVAFWIAVGTVVIMAIWSLASATYLAFRDDVLRSLIARQTEQQFAYEDRIAELRAQIDRTTSRQLLDQEQFEQKLDDLMRRQRMLESRANALAGGADPPTHASIKPKSADPTRGSARGDRGKQSSRGVIVGRLEASLERGEHRQGVVLSQMQVRYENKARQIRSTLAQLGVKVDATAPASGGPFIPVKLASEDQ